MPDLIGSAGAHDGGEFGRPDGGKGIVGQFDDIEAAAFERAEVVGEEGELLGLRSGRAVGRRLMSNGEIDA